MPDDNNTKTNNQTPDFKQVFLLTTLVDNTETPVNRSRTRMSAPYPEALICFTDPPDIRVSPFRIQPRVQLPEANPTPSDDQRSSEKDHWDSGPLIKSTAGYQAGIT